MKEHRRKDNIQKVTTDIKGKKGGFWYAHTIYCEPLKPKPFIAKVLGQSYARRISEIATAIKLFFKRPITIAYVTNGNLVGITLAILQTLCFWNRKSHVMIDCIWYLAKNQFKNRIFSIALRIASPSVSKFIVWASHEVEDYPAAFKLKRKKFQYVHFWHTLSGYEFKIRDDRYVFAGGNWDRDYRIIIEAAKSLPHIPFRIGTTRPEQFKGLEIPNNISINGYTHEGFRQEIASCSIMIVPMVKGVLHSGGQQSVLNAMFMGKPVISVGKRWATDLINDSEDGIIVDYEEYEGLAAAIKALWNDAGLRDRISINAAQKGASWPPGRSLKKIWMISLDEIEPLNQ